MLKIKIWFEKWKRHPKYKSLKVSNYGNIKENGKLLKSFIAQNSGYSMVFVKEVDSHRKVHVLVAETWLGKKEDAKLTIDHKDGNKRNNAASNLEYVTQKENLFRAQEKLFHIDIDELSKLMERYNVNEKILIKMIKEYGKPNKYNKNFITAPNGELWLKRYCIVNYLDINNYDSNMPFRIELNAKMGKTYLGYKLFIRDKMICGEKKK